MSPEGLKELQQYLHVVHHVPGRIRVKFDLALANHPLTEKMLKWQKTLPGIKTIRMNLAARSVIIEYDRKQIDPTLFQDLLTSGDVSRIREIIKSVTGAT